MARRRVNKDLGGTPAPTPDRQLEHPSGWCMTGYHKECKYQFDHGKCGCSCHVDPKLVKIEQTTESSDNEAPAPKKRGRPKGSKNKPKESHD